MKMCSAFQIRIAGAKGIQMIKPDLLISKKMKDLQDLSDENLDSLISE
jgi:hypothetical protein